MVKDLGLSPRAVLRAATSDAARALRLERETGALRPGLAADLVAMEGDPVEDIMSVWKVRLTVARGQAVEYTSGPRTLATSRGGGWE
jgi:imidazolonepropionase-like amidohydrolase